MNSDENEQTSDNTILGDASRMLPTIMFVSEWNSDLCPTGSSESHPRPSWTYAIRARRTNCLRVRAGFFKITMMCSSMILPTMTTDRL